MPCTYKNSRFATLQFNTSAEREASNTIQHREDQRRTYTGSMVTSETCATKTTVKLRF